MKMSSQVYNIALSASPLLPLRMPITVSTLVLYLFLWVAPLLLAAFAFVSFIISDSLNFIQEDQKRGGRCWIFKFFCNHSNVHNYSLQSRSRISSARKLCRWKKNDRVALPLINDKPKQTYIEVLQTKFHWKLHEKSACLSACLSVWALWVPLNKLKLI